MTNDIVSHLATSMAMARHRHNPLTVLAPSHFRLWSQYIPGTFPLWSPYGSDLETWHGIWPLSPSCTRLVSLISHVFSRQHWFFETRLFLLPLLQRRHLYWRLPKGLPFCSDLTSNQPAPYDDLTGRYKCPRQWPVSQVWSDADFIATANLRRTMPLFRDKQRIR